jgi:hypothetical protein
MGAGPATWSRSCSFVEGLTAEGQHGVPESRHGLIDTSSSSAVITAGVRFSRVIADETYGQVKYLRVWLEDHNAAYVLATERNDTLIIAALNSAWRPTLRH